MAKKNIITQTGLVGQTTPSTIILTQPKRFGIDIATYIQAIKSADNVDWSRRYKMYDMYLDILTDPHLLSVINKRKSALVSAPIIFQRAGIPDDKINEQLKSPWFYNYLYDLFDTLLFGISLFQFQRDKQGWIDYTMVDRKHIDPIHYQILRNQTDITGTSWDEYYNLLFVGNKYDLGLLVSAAPYVIYKRNTMGDWSQFSEIFGMPIREYTYDGADEEARTQVMNDAYNQGGAGVYIHPKDCNLELKESANKTGSAELYDKLVDRCNSEISKLILGNTLTTESNDKGTQALGTVQEHGENALKIADRNYILNILNYNMSDIFSALGINTQGGEFIYQETEDKDPEKQLRIIEGLYNMGLKIDEDSLYEMFGVKKPEANNILGKQTEEKPKEEPKQPLPDKETDYENKFFNKLMGLFSKKNNKQKKKDSFRLLVDKQYYGYCAKTPAFENVLKNEFAFNEKVLSESIKRIYNKEFDVENGIDEGIFNETIKGFNLAIDKGIKESKANAEKISGFIQELKTNTAVYAAFRTHRLQNDIAAQLVDKNGNLKPFQQYLKDVEPIASHNVRSWLRTEYDTAIQRAHIAANFKQFEEEKDVLPNLRWVPSTSPNPGEDHIIYWNIVLPGDDPFWTEHSPGDRWNCQCDVEATDNPVTEIPKTDKFEPSPGLENNPADDEKLFSENSPMIANSYPGAKEAVNNYLSDKK